MFNSIQFKIIYLHNTHTQKGYTNSSSLLISTVFLKMIWYQRPAPAWHEDSHYRYLPETNGTYTSVKSVFIYIKGYSGKKKEGEKQVFIVETYWWVELNWRSYLRDSVNILFLLNPVRMLQANFSEETIYGSYDKKIKK